MSFLKVIEEFENFDFAGYFDKVSDSDILNSINKSKKDYTDLLNLLSQKAEKFLENMASVANEITTRNFGKTILLYTPMYISNICVNKCAYCTYNIENDILRKKLTMEQIDEEAKRINAEGFRNILVLTGESEKHTNADYVVESVKVLRKHFESITIEIYPMKEEDYKRVVESGVDGLTVYQEVYDREIYKNVHLAGPKRNYNFRLDAPERGAKAGIRNLNIGALLGLNEFRREMFFTIMHGKYLLDKYPSVNLSFSFPRIRPHKGIFHLVDEVSDRNLVQSILVARLFHHNAGINISTRERQGFRENLIPLGVTKISAGVSTDVGGHTLEEDKGEKQFEISDDRTTKEIKTALNNMGYQAIFKDWDGI
ncbi:MAG: 2-iminoacetate synthase ThiH [Sarcina sp.]